MRTTNLISAYKGATVYEEQRSDANQVSKPYSLKNNEINTLSKLCDTIKNYDISFDVFDGYFIGYKIKQIGKEFDLLRFSDDLVVNIELKGHLDLPDDKKIEKILKQQSKNYHYLHALNKKVYICTFVEDDGLYGYQDESDSTAKIPFEELIDVLSNQIANEEINPDNLFIPSHYLISPFNKAPNFINGEYFLTDHQEEIKNNIISCLNADDYVVHCITANAGTGKTLLLYDIAKEISRKHNTLLIHCGKLNSGHDLLNDKYKWNITPISNINSNTVDDYITAEIKAIFIDEAQRIRTHQLEDIIEKSSELRIPIIFCYDVKQYLSKDENKDIYNYFKAKHSDIHLKEYKLTKKIRTNHNVASFINNLIQIGYDTSNTNFQNITIDYFNDINDVKNYIKYLEKKKGWRFITYTSSQYKPDPIEQLSGLSQRKAHDVIGQEFEKVVFVMDKNFYYGDDNHLKYSSNCYYDLGGMFYQIITRAVSELKIIVFDNESLYYQLLSIKSMDHQSER